MAHACQHQQRQGARSTPSVLHPFVATGLQLLLPSGSQQPTCTNHSGAIGFGKICVFRRSKFGISATLATELTFHAEHHCPCDYVGFTQNVITSLFGCKKYDRIKNKPLTSVSSSFSKFHLRDTFAIQQLLCEVKSRFLLDEVVHFRCLRTCPTRYFVQTHPPHPSLPYKLTVAFLLVLRRPPNNTGSIANKCGSPIWYR